MDSWGARRMERSLWHLRGTLLLVLNSFLSLSSCPVLLGSLQYGYIFHVWFSTKESALMVSQFPILYFSSCAFLLSSQDRISWNLSTFLKELDLPCFFFYSAGHGTRGLAHACHWALSPAFARLLLALTPLQSGNPHFCIPDLPSTPRFLFLKQTLAINWHFFYFLSQFPVFPSFKAHLMSHYLREVFAISVYHNVLNIKRLSWHLLCDLKTHT